MCFRNTLMLLFLELLLDTHRTAGALKFDEVARRNKVTDTELLLLRCGELCAVLAERVDHHVEKFGPAEVLGRHTVCRVVAGALFEDGRLAVNAPPLSAHILNEGALCKRCRSEECKNDEQANSHLRL